MAWKPGELWLDGDVAWFGNRGGGAAVAVWMPPALPSFGPPPGLAASRARREAWKRRRKTRKLRTAAIALTPAVVLPMTALRNNGSDTTLVLDDPPSLTIRLGPTETSTPRRRAATIPSARSLQATEARPRPTEVHREPSYPPVVWRHATSTGVPWSGGLINGTQFPIAGPNWVTWNPVTDSVPNAPERLYGNERTIRILIEVIDAYRAANPGAPQVVVGDISREGGGGFFDEHLSHQNGLDVDVYYPRLDGVLADPGSPDRIDHQLAQDLVDRFVAAGAQMVLVGPSTGLTGPGGVVIPYANHDNHMHVRFTTG